MPRLPGAPRETADLVALMLAFVVVVVVIGTAAALLFVQVFHPNQSVEAAGDFVSRVISVLVAALVGYMAGRSTASLPPDEP